MRRSTRWFIVLMTMAVAACIGIVAVCRLSTSAPTVHAGSVLRVDLQGSWPEHDPNAAFNHLFGVDVLTLQDLVAALDAAGEDERIRALQLRVGLLDVGWARAQEIRSALVRFRATGKPVHAYLEYGNDGTYYIASAADEVRMIQTGTLWLDGISAEVEFYAGTLEKIGVTADLEQIGEFKNAADVMERTTMSEAHRAAMESLVGSLYDEMVGSLAESLGIPGEEVDRLVAGGPYTADEAVAAGLLDGVAFEDEAWRALDDVIDENGEAERIDLDDYAEGVDASSDGPPIAIVHCVGTIVPGQSSDSLFGGSVMGSETIAGAIEDASEIPGLEALVLRVDSPGGSPVASDVIWRATQRIRDQGVPVVVSMSDVAASGGYWIAMGADRIVAEPSTLTGSIGIYGGKYVLAELQRKVALSTEPVERGRNAGINSSRQPFSDEQREWLRTSLRTTYDLFLERVAEGRGFDSPADVDALARGRVWTGRQALENRLVDELGGLREAVTAAKRLAGLPEDAPVSIRSLPRSPTLVEMFFRDGAGTTVARLLREAAVSELRTQIPREAREAAAHAAVMVRLAEDGVLALSPLDVPAR